MGKICCDQRPFSKRIVVSLEFLVYSTLVVRIKLKGVISHKILPKSP